MDEDDRPRSVLRVILAVAVICALMIVLGVVGTLVFSTFGGGADGPPPEREPDDSAAEAAPETDRVPEPEPELPPRVAPSPIPAEELLLRAMPAPEVEAQGRAVASRTPGFRFDRIERFTDRAGMPHIAVLVHDGTGLEFSLVPAGTFAMGSHESEGGRPFELGLHERPVHTVTIEQPFLLARTECTVRAWTLGNGAAEQGGAEPDAPVVGIDWNEARQWCEELGMRLPSEAEWEYACRAGSRTRYWSGDEVVDLTRVDWCGENEDYDEGGGRRMVALKPANPFGLHDLHGNVWEWCEDASHRTYEGAPTDGSAWRSQGDEVSSHVVRGASHQDAWWNARSAFRYSRPPDHSNDVLGFRPARSVPPE